MLKKDVPAAVGVPERRPELVNVSPAGRVDPVVTAHEYGAVPPEAANCSLYATLTVPPGSGDAVVMARLLILMVKDADAVVPVESLT
jgi:hypothetical protein